MRFSVGIPAYNQGDFLEQTILSLLNQRRPPDEIVISDHQSTDSTPDVIAKYAGQVRGVQPPLGSDISGQWNYTLSCLTGDWCTLFSSDDLAYPNFCEALIRGAESRSDAVLVRAGWQNIDAAGKVISQEYLLSVPPVVNPPQTLIEQRYGPKASFAAFAVHRETLVKSGGYPLAMESFGDWPMFMQLAPFGSFIYVDEIVSGYRHHGGNKFRQRISMWLRDEQRMFYEVMPLAADRAGMTTPESRAWIKEGERENFLRYLTDACAEWPTAADRAEILPELANWARRGGFERELKTFAEGGSVRRPFNPGRIARAALRPHVHRARALMRKLKG